MCIIGCYPKRAGYDFFNDVIENPSRVEELSKQHSIKTRIINFPVKRLISKKQIATKEIDNEYKTKTFKDEKLRNIINGYAAKIKKRIKTPKDYIFQGALLIGSGKVNNIYFWNYFIANLQGSLSYYPNFKKHFRAIATRSFLKKGKNDYPDGIKIIIAFSREDNIKSYLYGDKRFSWTHWFVKNQSIDINKLNLNNLEKNIKVIKINTFKEGKEFARSLMNKKIVTPYKSKNPYLTRCVFCSRYMLKKIFPSLKKDAILFSASVELPFLLK